MEWTRLTLKVEPGWADAASDQCCRLGAAGTWIEDQPEYCLVHAFYPAEVPLDTLNGLVQAMLCAGIETHCSTIAVDDEEWCDSWKRFWRRMNVGRRLLVLPAWDDEPLPPDRIPIRIDPGMAFGTGQHATTILMLEALEREELPGRIILDLGTGSAILAVAAAKLGASVVALDNDPVAVTAARANAGDTAEITVVQGDARTPGAVGRFDLILSNLTSDLIRELAAVLPPYLNPGGRWLASGIVRDREQETMSALVAAGWRLCEREAREEWILLILDRGAI